MELKIQHLHLVAKLSRDGRDGSFAAGFLTLEMPELETKVKLDQDGVALSQVNSVGLLITSRYRMLVRKGSKL